MPTATSGRLLTLLSLLQARRDWPGGLLAQRLAVSPRTVRRDVDRLRELGYPVAATKGPEGGYRLDAGADLPPLLFDDEQAVALAVALHLAAAGAGGAGTEEAAARALTTVRQVMPARLRRRVDAVTVTAVPPGSGRVDPAVLTAVTAAAHAREVLRFDYGVAADATDAPPRRAEPHHVVHRGGRWYLVGWDLDRAAWRTFRLDRVRPRTPNGPRFAPRDLPASDVAAFLADRFRGGSGAGSGAWPCRGEAVVERPAADLAPYATDLVVEELGPGRCRVLGGSWSWGGLAARFAGFDTDLSAVEPAGLRAAFTALSRRAARAAATGAAAAG